MHTGTLDFLYWSYLLASNLPNAFKFRSDRKVRQLVVVVPFLFLVRRGCLKKYVARTRGTGMIKVRLITIVKTCLQ